MQLARKVTALAVLFVHQLLRKPAQLLMRLRVFRDVLDHSDSTGDVPIIVGQRKRINTMDPHATTGCAIAGHILTRLSGLEGPFHGVAQALPIVWVHSSPINVQRRVLL